MTRTAQVTCLGDLRCPACRSILVTPVSESGRLMVLQPGKVECPVCRKGFEVTETTARKANRRLTVTSSEVLEEVIQQLLDEDD